MVRIRLVGIVCVLVALAALGGCGGTGQLGSGGGHNGNSSVVLAMTDSPPSLVTILSAQVTLTGATLSPGNVSLLSSPVTIELTRLQTDIAYLGTAANIPSGAYTSVTLTFAVPSPSITFENDTASTLAGCNVGLICTMTPAASPMSATVPLSSFSLGPSSAAGLLIDVNLENLLNSSLVEDFSAGTSVFPFTAAGSNAPLIGAEDVVGQVSNVSASNSTFTLANAEASYSLKTNSSTAFLFSPGTSCSGSGFSCLANGQILSVDIGIQSDGSIVARNIFFEDANNSDPEVEGIVTSTNAGAQQFDFVIHTISALGTGQSVGAPVTVQYASTTPFDVDLIHADSSAITNTSCCSFAGPADLVAGQEVSIRWHNPLSGGVLSADRVRLRSSRITGFVVRAGSSMITLQDLPSLFSSHGGVSAVLAQTSVTPPTIYYEVNGSINSSTNITNQTVAVRGPLFNTGGTNRTQITTKVVLK